MGRNYYHRKPVMTEPRKHMFWNGENVASLKRMVEEGQSATQIARMLDISSRMVVKYCEDNGIEITFKQTKPWSQHEKDYIKEQSEKGAPSYLIAKHLGRSKDAVQRMIREALGVTRERVPKSPPVTQFIQYDYPSLTAKMFGDPPVGRDYLSRRLRGEV